MQVLLAPPRRADYPAEGAPSSFSAEAWLYPAKFSEQQALYVRYRFARMRAALLGTDCSLQTYERLEASRTSVLNRNVLLKRAEEDSEDVCAGARSCQICCAGNRANSGDLTPPCTPLRSCKACSPRLART